MKKLEDVRKDSVEHFVSKAVFLSVNNTDKNTAYIDLEKMVEKDIQGKIILKFSKRRTQLGSYSH